MEIYRGIFMIKRKEALEFGLSFQNTYEERPFHDQTWQLVRVKESKKAFLWIFEIRNGVIFGEVHMKQ